MKVTVTLDARQAEAMRIVACKEHRPIVQYLRDAVHFLLQDRATDDPEVRRALGLDPPVAEPALAAPEGEVRR